MRDERRRNLMSQQRINKRADTRFPRSLPATPKRTRNELQRDSALQFVSLSQSLT